MVSPPFPMPSPLTFSGNGGCLPYRKTRSARHPILHGPNIHGHLLPRNVCQMAGIGICQVFHKCLVLAGLCHRDGKIV